MKMQGEFATSQGYLHFATNSLRQHIPKRECTWNPMVFNSDLHVCLNRKIKEGDYEAICIELFLRLLPFPFTWLSSHEKNKREKNQNQNLFILAKQKLEFIWLPKNLLWEKSLTFMLGLPFTHTPIQINLCWKAKYHTQERPVFCHSFITHRHHL